jgi:hypothetical protein
MALNIIPSDSASIFSVLTAAQTMALVRPQNPPPGLAGLIFDISGDETLRLRSQISQHFVEDNTTIQDQIALEPERVVLRKFMGELVYTKPTTSPISAVPNALPLNMGMMPVLTPGANQTLNASNATVASANNAAEAPNSLWSYYENSAGAAPNQTRQSIVMGYLYQLWLGRQLFTVETPWGVFTSMAIEMIDGEQPEETKFRTDMMITFQKIRTAGSVSVNVGQLAGRLNAQASPVANGGKSGLAPVSTAQNSSILKQILYPP